MCVCCAYFMGDMYLSRPRLLLREGATLVLKSGMNRQAHLLHSLYQVRKDEREEEGKEEIQWPGVCVCVRARSTRPLLSFLFQWLELQHRSILSQFLWVRSPGTA